MVLDQVQLEKLLCERLCADVKIYRREDDVLMMESPFTFPDGDHFPIYLSETTGGGVKLSDRGHTLMQISYEHDVELFYDGARASLRDHIVRESGIEEVEGIFSIEAPPDLVAATLFKFGQALTKIHDLTFLSRERVASMFYEDLRELVFTILDEDVVETDYIPPEVPDAIHYPVDYRFAGKNGKSVFLYGIPGRDKARLTIINAVAFLASRCAL
ncbi:MAG: DUF1828 domain-containing protein [Albidovulum sp.]|nr:DUF1828 domain-containing protein [Albidovulum sp.]